MSKKENGEEVFPLLDHLVDENQKRKRKRREKERKEKNEERKEKMKEKTRKWESVTCGMKESEGKFPPTFD